MGLTNVEEKLISALAEKGPLTGYAIHKKEKIMSNAHWERVKETLGPDGLALIFEIETEGRSKPYWLTGSGINQALRLQAKPELLEKYIKEIYDEQKSEPLLILTNIAKEYEISPIIWDYMGQLGYKMSRGESPILTIFEMLANVSEDMMNTMVVIGAVHFPEPVGRH